MRTEYMILQSGDSEHLGKLVTEKLADGWIVHGSLAACINRLNNPVLYQPMMRYSEE